MTGKKEIVRITPIKYPKIKVLEHAPQHTPKEDGMISSSPSDKTSVFVVPDEVFAQLDPIEKIVIRRQAERGDVVIEENNKPIMSRAVVNSLDNLHRAILEIMAEDGKIIIRDCTLQDIEKEVNDSQMIEFFMDRTMEQIEKTVEFFIRKCGWEKGSRICKDMILGKRNLDTVEVAKPLDVISKLNKAQKQYIFKRMGWDINEVE
jgi:hypothetical protein